MTIANIKFLLLSCLLLLSFVASAQTNYLLGYYVSNNSDTIRGFIEYRAIDKMHRAIRFKSSRDAKPVKLKAGGTISVVIDDSNYFESHSSMNRRGFGEVGFFKKVIAGRLSLYRFNDRYFVVKAGENKMMEISKSAKVREDRKVVTDYVGLGTLKLLTRDCPSFEEGFLMDQYKTIPDYRLLVNTYNQCFSESHAEIKDIRIASHVDYGVHGSLNMTNLDFQKVNRLAHADFGARISATGGLFVSFFFPRFGDNLRIVWEPGFGRSNRYAYFQSNGDAQDVYLRYSYVRSPVLLRYFKNRLFFDIGINNYFVLNQKVTWRTESVSNNVVVTSTGPSYKLKSGLTGAMLGIGSRLDLGGIPIYTSIRFSGILPFRRNTLEQPSVRWLDFNVAVQLNRR